jgi:hypothetical protein
MICHASVSPTSLDATAAGNGQDQITTGVNPPNVVRASADERHTAHSDGFGSGGKRLPKPLEVSISLFKLPAQLLAAALLKNSSEATNSSPMVKNGNPFCSCATQEFNPPVSACLCRKTS